jgi:enoyl-CoA hydratase
MVLAEIYSPADAVAAGFLDRTVAPDELGGAARDIAAALIGLDRPAYRATKARVRGAASRHLRDAIERDDRALASSLPGAAG